jgi:hypothetical protein
MSHFGRGHLSGEASNWRTFETTTGRRGSGRGSPRGKSWNNSFYTPQKDKPVYPPQQFGKLLLSIHKSELEGGQDASDILRLSKDTDDAQLADWLTEFRGRHTDGLTEKTIEEHKYIASYSWLDGHHPKVIIPGKHFPL